MNFWKNIFNTKNKATKKATRYDTYRKELNELNLKTIADLENLVRPIIRTATKLEISEAKRPPENAQLDSHFGGQPYFEKNEFWPKSKNGKHLDFIFQVFNDDSLVLPKNIKLIQFYYDWDAAPWETSNDGWLVKPYKKTTKENLTLIEKPSELEKSHYCDITFTTTNSLPDWEGINLHSKTTSKLSCVLDENEPWDSYDQIATKLIGAQDYQSQLGGYPKWVQGKATPKDTNGKPMRLLFQIDSEEHAGLLWGDVGLIYVFYDEKSEKIEFTLQCH